MITTFRRTWTAAIALLLVIATVGRGEAGQGVSPSAAASAWAETAHGAVRLIAGVDGVGTGGTLPLGLEFRMAEGWHIYWRSPGDAGYPPHLDWSGSENLERATVLWPAPHRISAAGLETLGYSNTVVLPIEARLKTPAAPLRLNLVVDYLTCADICVPYTVRLALDLPAAPADASAFAPVIDAFRAKVPAAVDGTGGGTVAAPLAIEAVSASGAAADLTLHIVARAAAPFERPDVFIEGREPLSFGAPAVRLADGGRSAVFDVSVSGFAGPAAALSGERLVVTLADGGRAIEQPVTVAPAESDAAAPESRAPVASAAPTWAAMLVVAWLGGLILNLMPCVLPVLSIKLMSVVGHGGSDRRTVRVGFLASAAGILAAFLLLAAGLIALESAGAAVGWGVQFQQPWFLTAMVLVVTLFACNLWGLFEVPLPGAIADAGARTAHVQGIGGHFLGGALATLLATPCSAPFVGTAVSFALAGGAEQILVIFTAMAAGLATPYLLVAAVPSLAARLPRPGPWMRTLRRVLGVALALTALWLLTVLAVQIGTAAALAVGAAAVCAVLVLALSRRRPGRNRTAVGTLVVLASVAAFIFALGTPSPQRGAADATPSLWQPFDEARIADLVSGGTVVLVNVTADWCLTCKVNERLVLSRPPVDERLRGEGIVAMRADWTQPDQEIAGYLKRFGRYGIPFDAVYGPGLPAGEALPELLTADLVMRALDRAAGATAAIGAAPQAAIGVTR